MTICGLRGSNEPLRANGGMGRTVATIVDRLVAELQRSEPGIRCDLVAIPYPASGVHWSLITGSLRASIEAGRRLLVDAIDQAVRSNRNSRIVIVGLSQGAASARLALHDLLVRRSSDGRPLHESVDAVLLYADPLRVAVSPCNRPPNPPLDGALTWLWRSRITIPEDFVGRVACFCDARNGVLDPICAFKPGPLTVASLYGNLIHTTYHLPERASGWDGPKFAVERMLTRFKAAAEPGQ